MKRISDKEALFGIILGIIIILIILYLFLCWWNEKQNAIAEQKVTVTIYQHDLSGTQSNALIWETGPGYRRAQFQCRLGATGWLSESFYAEVKR